MSGHVPTSLGKTSKKNPSRSLYPAYLYPKTAPTHHEPCAMVAMRWIPSNEELQAQASASKLQQLPWTTAFEDLQLLLRSADAQGLNP